MEEYYRKELYAKHEYTIEAEDMLDTMIMAVGILHFDWHEFSENLRRKSD